MSGFHALNIESDDESDIEIDDTKEIQIEEALKLYQIALRFHSEGPDSYEKASIAYQQLFDSEIFKYPESQTELQRIELYGASPEIETIWDDVVPGSVTAANSLDTGPSTLPQVLHLSHKNYAQFKLDALEAKFDIFNVTLNQILADATAALNHFVQALDKDDSDIDLWRRTASVGEILDSGRVARYCLESVLDGDEEGLGGMLSLPGLEEGSAAEKLRELVGDMQDQLSLLQSPLLINKRKVLSKALKERLHPYFDILQRESELRKQQEKATIQEPDRIVLKRPQTWAEMGDILLRQLLAEQHGTSSARPGVAVAFDLSTTESEDEMAVEQLMSPDEPPSPVNTSALTAYPSSIDEQFPGLDYGKPTTQPQIAPAHPSMRLETRPRSDSDANMMDSPTLTLPSRKRSGDAAGLNDGLEESRSKSRRTRARESNADTGDTRKALIEANIQWEYEQQLNEFQAADDWMFETVGNLFEKVGIVGFGAAKNIRQELQIASPGEHSASADTEPTAEPDLRCARADLHAFLHQYNEQLAHLFRNSSESLDISQSMNAAGNLFASGGTSTSPSKTPLLPNDGLDELIQSLNDDWTLVQAAAWRFIGALLIPGRLSSSSPGNSYIQFLWPESLKTMVVRILVNFDETIFKQTAAELNKLRECVTNEEDLKATALAEMAQTIFELHLDIYCLIKSPNSGVESATVISQGERLNRWAELSREVMQVCREADVDENGTPSLKDALSLRFLWATACNIGASSDIAQEHVLECMSDLRRIFVAAGEPCLQLQNNAIMPELSVSALDREVSKLTTREFFLKITNQDVKEEPAAVIESLEPLLECVMPERHMSDNEVDEAPGKPAPYSANPELVSFLESSPITVKLLLWQRLRDAYVNIDYSPMVTYCYLRMIRMVLKDMKSSDKINLARSERQVLVIESLRLVREMVTKLYTLVQTDKSALECVDEPGLRLAVSSFGEVLQLLQVFNIAHDNIHVGKSDPPSLPSGLPAPSFAAITTIVHEMQVQLWIVLYALLKEAILQNAESYPSPLEDRFDFLRTVHRNLGLRGICGVANRAFVRMLKDELFQMTHVEGYDSEQAQVLYDLYGINCFLNPSYELIEHRCTRDAFLDRGVALQSTDLLLAQASKLPMRELVKHSLKDTIEKVHGALPKKKSTEAIVKNRDAYRAYLRSPINPLDLFDCLKGEGNHLPVTAIDKNDVLLASKGWYFLMGQMALTRFRCQKRTAPAPLEDVEIAIAFFLQDLEYSSERWETWYRLGQAYDTKIEENVVWSAEKLNSQMPEIIALQKNAIHCYTMATSLAHRCADLAFKTSDKMASLYEDFATRLYSSSREPFSMQPFALQEEVDRFVTKSNNVCKDKSFRPLRLYAAWKLANALFGRALARQPDNWMLHYMVGKCRWKMHSAPESLRLTGEKREVPPTGHDVLACFLRALELLPEKDKKEGKDTKREPVLEPHYKLLSITHKLVLLGSISLQEGIAALDRTQYSRLITGPDTLADWPEYALTVLKRIRAADKSNWYHRMIARAAHIKYTTPYNPAYRTTPNVDAARNEMMGDLFTKTMVLQVWRPEAERAGRHFVYTARYTRFLVKILQELRDRASMETLARRVRRRPHDIFEHSLVWQDICTAYLSMLRAHGQLSEGLETSTFSNISHEEFLARKEPLEKWMEKQDPGTLPALDVMRDVQELKKINQGLMKPSAIDDLIGDSYASLFNGIGKTLWEEYKREQREEEAKKVPVSPPRSQVMSLNHLMNTDGASDAHPPAVPPQASTVVNDPASGASKKIGAGRKTGVGRREIRACAEAGFQKSSAQQSRKDEVTATVIRPAQVVIPRHRPLDLQTVPESAPGSVHDSADDESELSELEEEGDDEGGGPESDDEEAPNEAPALRPTFPGLTSITAHGKQEEGARRDEAERNKSVAAVEQNEDVEMLDEGKDDGEKMIDDAMVAVQA
ncbi:uncharacterized protein RCC_01937 [Ramularia collo-cygni]|uniref:Histone transcription regulator 3 homolog n=1 Tax=Ramularia collo-cygni TaxID=112498 RepID=A0A2D3UY53_9PEZI|nr:uncharacterized protein RCC_01937 [Ramularia collo-cygni]CZT16096.1 uncharacterized protein RCC_01937 [Ramularia collo-cygni]